MQTISILLVISIAEGAEDGESGSARKVRKGGRSPETSSITLGTEVELEVAQAERQDIDMFLEDTAERNNLTVANVKSILKVYEFAIKVPSE